MEQKEQALQTQSTSGGALTTVSVTTEQKALIKSTIMFPNATDDETALFIFNCQRIGIHPLDKMIHPIKFNGDDPKMIFINSIDLFRSMAEETGEYDGQDEAEYEWNEEKDPDHTGYPLLARIKIYRKEMTRPIIGIARWTEFYPGDGKRGNIWRKMPCNQLAKCAEAQAFRKAFPKKFHEFYIAEEMDQAADDPKEQRKDRSASVKPAVPPAQQITVIDAETVSENPLDKEITEILAALYLGVWEDMNAGLIEASKFKDKDTKKEVKCSGLEKLTSMGAAWKTHTILPRLHKMKEEAEALAQEIKGDPAEAATDIEEKQDIPM